MWHVVCYIYFLCAGAHREVFFRIRAALGPRPPKLSHQDGNEMMFDPASFALLLTLSVLAVVLGILAFERFWLLRKNSETGAKEYGAGTGKY